MFQVFSMKLFLLFNFWFEALTYLFGLSLISQTPHAVQWMRPEAQEGCLVSDWFNMLVLHQNRLCVSETVLVRTSVWKCLCFCLLFLKRKCLGLSLKFYLTWTFWHSHCLLELLNCILYCNFFLFWIFYCGLQSENKPKKCYKWTFSTKVPGLYSVGSWTWMPCWSTGATSIFFSTIFFVCISLNWRWVLI